MKEFAKRLKKGNDLKKTIEDICLKKNIDSAVVLSSVGSLKSLTIRLAGAKRNLTCKEDLEIISLNGTISKGEAHLHISVSDEIGNVFGGHLKEGTIVNTTCELVLGILEEYETSRSMDNKTGYKEIEFKRKKD